MRKTFFLLTVIAITFALPKNVFSQTYFTSKGQIDITASGDKKKGYHSATLIFDKQVLLMKFDDMKESDSYNLKYYSSDEDEETKTTMYLITNISFFQALYVFEYKKVHNEGGITYSYNFTLIRDNEDGSISHSTSFFANKM